MALRPLSLAANVEIVTGNLSFRCSEVAFALATLITQEFEAGWEPDVEDDDEDDETPIQAMSWDTPERALPADLAFLWTGVNNGSRRLKVKELMDRIANKEI